MTSAFNDLIGNTIKKVFLIVFPPYGETEYQNIDTSIGLVTIENPNKVYVISTDKSDNWTPMLQQKDMPDEVLPFILFDKRMSQWMYLEIEDEIRCEYYEFTESEIFNNIVDNKIADIELILTEQDAWFGVKILFADDFIISSPISDGNTIQTKKFEKFDNLANFSVFGKTKFKNISLML